MTRTESGLALRPLASQARTLGTCCPKEQVAGEGPPAWVVAEGWGISRAPLTPGRTRRLPACGSCSCEIAAPGLLPPPQAPSPCWPHTCAHTLTAAPPCARPLTRWDAVMAGDTLDPRGTMTIRAGACTGAGAVPAPPRPQVPRGPGPQVLPTPGDSQVAPGVPPETQAPESPGWQGSEAPHTSEPETVEMGSTAKRTWATPCEYEGPASQWGLPEPLPCWRALWLP